MNTEEKIKLVERRLYFINQLTEIRDHFRGRDITTRINNLIEIDHQYIHYSALRIYLALTCFDILGQDDDWLDFNSWLKSKKKEKERNLIFEKHKNKLLNESIIEINDDYNKIYGVRNSFMRFIKETLSLENQNKLFNSIRGSIKLTDSIRNQDGTQTIATGADYNLNQKEKEDFIYYIRNSFTHKGIPLGDTRGGYFDREGPMNLGSIKEPELLWRQVALYSKKIDGNEITFGVIKWPELLIEIIEDTLKNYEC